MDNGSVVCDIPEELHKKTYMHHCTALILVSKMYEKHPR